ncbi:endonuclease/exonuclease/phosphatase family protein [Blastopirellula sp. JC732]|uniref:Endonuclease/exonuclease/phosphatase family protein n=1 Tax=Blastopirellula sediminis TaxID=2894196 RepID=A0A9X1MQB6_9BACT|nr:lamin tail domain-containing protein [Blastopirellula sediminis]MCC9606636.1 endonuclease/exonuclease/phosphatase family protein [Blastopirellula sediminis]MCC9630067.1 endonuclease/exonuclease/phosphatase family protein [Blastopirellula sediminis]
MRISSLLIALSLLCTGACTPAAADIIQVGSWNIEWLGKPEMRNSPPQKPEDLAAEIETAGVDVLALQEICDDYPEHDRLGNKTLDQVVALLNRRKGNDWKYELFPKRDVYAEAQLTGVAWNEARVKRVGGAMRIEPVDLLGDNYYTWDRQPHAAKFSAGEGKTDFVIIPLHMKSNYGSSTSEMAKHRAAEASALIVELPKIKKTFGDDDIILIGDTNMLSAKEEGEKKFVGAGFRDLNAEDQNTHVKDAPFDRVFVPKDQKEFANSREVVHTAKNSRDYERKLSDHYLISFQILVGADDDDGGAPPAASVAPQMPRPSPQKSTDLQILAVLPDPYSQDDGKEAVVLASSSTRALSLDGWKLLDDDGGEIKLSGEIPPCSVITIHNPGQSWLSNSGDELRLVDPQGTIIDDVSYTRDDVAPGKYVTNLKRR